VIGPEAVACATTGVDGVDRGLPIQPGYGEQTLAIIEREAELAKIGVGQ
jgi:hypothetical protein